MIWNIQGLHKRMTIPALYILSSMLLMEALIDRKCLCMIPPMTRNPTQNDIHRQIHVALKDHKYNCWVIKTQAILQKYCLPHLIHVVRLRSSKEKWKKMLDEAILQYWKKNVEEEALNKNINIHHEMVILRQASSTVGLFSIRPKGCPPSLDQGHNTGQCIHTPHE